MIAYHFPPRPGVGVQRSAKFAKYLPSFAYEPHIITVSEDQFNGVCKLDSGLLAEVAHLRIHRVWSSERFVRTLAHFGLSPLVEFVLRPDKTRLWVRHAIRAARRIAQQHNIELVYASLSPWSSVLVGLALKREFGIPLVLDFRDPWTQSTMTLWPSRIHYWYDRLTERNAISEADAVVVATPGMAAVMLEAYPWLRPKLNVIYNGYDSTDVSGDGPSNDESRLTIGYAGTFADWSPHARFRRKLKERLGYRICAVDESTYSPLFLLRAVCELLAERPDLRRLIRLRFAGLFGEANQSLVTQLGLADVVDLRGYLSHMEAVDLLQRSDVLFLGIETERDRRRSYNVSGKIFEYLGLHKPILAAVPEGDAADLVRQARAGWVVDPYDVAGMKALLRHLIAEKRSHGIGIHPNLSFIRQFDRRRLTAQLADVFDRVLGTTAP